MIVLGIMSGTSLDGMDLALVEFPDGRPQDYRFLHTRTYPYPDEWTDRLHNAYDATAVIGLAAYAAKVKGLPLTSTNIRDQLRRVANPPGKFIGAGDFKKAFALLEKGQSINYQGASGPVDFDEKGDVLAPIEIWKFAKGGAIVTYSIEYQIPQE